MGDDDDESSKGGEYSVANRSKTYSHHLSGWRHNVRRVTTSDRDQLAFAFALATTLYRHCSEEGKGKSGEEGREGGDGVGEGKGTAVNAQQQQAAPDLVAAPTRGVDRLKDDDDDDVDKKEKTKAPFFLFGPHSSSRLVITPHHDSSSLASPLVFFLLLSEGDEKACGALCHWYEGNSVAMALPKTLISPKTKISP
jgi:hypothetical protein